MRKIFLNLLFLLGLAIIFAPMAFAEFSLSITPTVTRNHIEFGEVDEGAIETEEAEIVIANDTGVRYRLTQTLFTPLENEYGNTISSDLVKLFIRDADEGTVHVDVPTNLDTVAIDLYTSDDSGTGDDMILAYTIFVPDKINGGTYRGSITFDLVPLTASNDATLQSVTLDISFQVKSVFHLSVENDRGMTRLDFGGVSLGESEKKAELYFEVFGNIGASYQVQQSLSEPLMNQSNGQLIPGENITLFVSGADSGTTASGETLSNSSTLYQSDSTGSSDQFVAQYTVQNLDQIASGEYNGTIQITVDTDAFSVDTSGSDYTIPVSLTIEDIFDFVIQPVDGSSLHFRNLRPGHVVENQLMVELNNNTGQPYQFQQFVMEPFISSSGEQIPADNFLIRIDSAQYGTPSITNFQAVEVGQMVLYTSNETGQSDRFIITYQLSVPENARGGDYSTQLSFSLTVI